MQKHMYRNYDSIYTSQAKDIFANKKTSTQIFLLVDLWSETSFILHRKSSQEIFIEIPQIVIKNNLKIIREIFDRVEEIKVWLESQASSGKYQ